MSGESEHHQPQNEEASTRFLERKEQLASYGRSSETKLLFDAYKRVRDSPISELVMVHGDAGSGKNTLIQQLKDLSASDECYFCEAKFDPVGYAGPYAVVMEACNQLCRHILKSDDLEQVRQNIQSKVGPEMQVLNQVMTQFQELSGIGDDSQTHKSRRLSQGLTRLKVVCRSFFRCIYSSKHPIVICLKDLQWSDESSLQLIRALINDRNAKHLLILCSFQDDVMKQEKIDTYLLSSNENRPGSISFSTHSFKNMGIVDIPLPDLHPAMVNEIVAELCQKDASTTVELAKAIHGKTHGNPYFTLQYMDQLFSEGILHLNPITQELDYALPQVLAHSDASDNIVAALALKIQSLSPQLQSVLHLASYFGYHFSADLLESVGKQVGTKFATSTVLYRDSMMNALSIGLREGLLGKEDGRMYRFTHDAVRETCYSLTPSKEEQELLHLQIGRILMEDISEVSNVEESMLFLAVENLNRGIAHITTAEEKQKVVALNLEAAKCSAQKAASFATVQYLRAGIGLLAGNEWNRNYELCLEIYSMAADFEHSTGNFVRSKIMCNEVHRNAHTLEDQIPVFLTEVASMGTQGDLGASIMLGVSLLKKLGEALPKSPNKFQVILELTKARHAIGKQSDQELLSLPLMVDPRKISAMKLLSSLSLYAFLLNERGQDLFAVILLRMTRLSCRYGLSIQSPLGFLGYGIMFSALGNPGLGFRFGDLATEMTRQLEAIEMSCRTIHLRIAMLDIWRFPFNELKGPLREQYHSGLLHGDPEFAYLGITLRLTWQFHTGTHLDELLESCSVYCGEMEEFQLLNALWVLLPIWQMLEKLRGNEANPETLRGNIFDYDALVTEMMHNHQAASYSLLRLTEVLLAESFDDFEAIPSLIRECWKHRKVFAGHAASIFYILTIGRACSVMVRETGKRKYRTKGRRIRQLLDKMTSNGAVAAESSASFMGALMATSKSNSLNKDSAEQLLRDAIEICHRDSNTALEGELYERLVDVMLDYGDHEKATTFLQFAIKTYDGIGVASKVVFLKQKYPELVNTKHNASVNTTVRSLGYDSFVVAGPT